MNSFKYLLSYYAPGPMVGSGYTEMGKITMVFVVYDLTLSDPFNSISTKLYHCFLNPASSY